MTRHPVDRARAGMLGRVVLPAADLVLGQRMMARLRYLDVAQWWSRDRVLAERDRALVRVVATAMTEVPFYRDLYGAAGVDARVIREADDLTALPVVGKDDLRAAGRLRITRPTGQRTHDQCSSGSTGAPFCVQEDARTAGWHRASFLQILSWAGWSLGQPHVQFGVTPDRAGGRAVKDRLLRCSYVSVYELDDEVLDRALERIERRGIRFVFGYPEGVAELTRRARARGRALELDGVVTWGDTLTADVRSTIEAVGGCPVLDAYGCAEGMWIASQCEQRGLHHVHSLDVIVELLDDDGVPCPPGVPGHVVVTRLHAGPTPLLRYRTGDLAVGTTATCACGRGYETIGPVAGRSADTLVTASGRRLVLHFFTGIFDHAQDIASFQVAKTAVDRVELRVAPPTEAARVEAEDAARRIRSLVPDLRVDVRLVDRVPRTSAGKRRFVVDETGPPIAR